MQKYETIFVIDSLLKSDEIEANIAKYEKFISANGGIIEVIDRWGKKRLAYEIKKRQYGFYVLIRFDGPGTIVKQLEREYHLNESILRYMTLRLNKQALKMLEKQQRSAAPIAKETPKNDSQDQEKVAESDPGVEPESGVLPDEQSENSAEPESGVLSDEQSENSAEPESGVLPDEQSESSAEPESGVLSDEQSENSAEKGEAEGEPESEAKIETESALAEEPPPPVAEAVEDRTKTE